MTLAGQNDMESGSCQFPQEYSFLFGTALSRNFKEIHIIWKIPLQSAPLRPTAAVVILTVTVNPRVVCCYGGQLVESLSLGSAPGLGLNEPGFGTLRRSHVRRWLYCSTCRVF